MASRVDITIKAKDEASEEIGDVTDSLSDLEGGAEELKEGGSKSFGDFMDNVSIAMLGINQAIEIGMKIAEAAKKLYESTVGKALDVAGELEELMRVSGEAPEKLSGLRIEAEKADVPFDDLYKAMENLNKNGIPPTIDNLVGIADEYVKLKDPIEKAKLLTENFGLAGDDIAPMLENIAGGIEDVQNAGLIFTEEDIQNVNDYTEALADFNVAKEGFLVEIGQTFLPSLTEILQNLSGMPTEMDKLYDDVYAALDKALTTGAIKLDTYNFILKDVKTVTGTYSEQVDKLNTHLGFLNDMTGDASTATEGMTEAEIEMADAAIAAALAQAEMIAEFENITTLDNNYKGIIDLAYEYTDILAEITVQEQIMAEEPIGSEKYEEAKAKVDELKGSMDELANRVTLDMLQATIAIGGVTEAELSAYMQMAIDMGLMSEEGAQAAMDAYGNAIETINGYELDDKTGNIKFEIDDSAIRDYSPPTRYGTVVYTPSTRQTQAAGGAVYAAASGLAASLPYYWVGERGPEPFFPSVDGRIVSNTQAMSALRGGTNAGEIAEAVKKGVKEAIRDRNIGNIYNLTMPTSSNPADVKTAFELMEAWA